MQSTKTITTFSEKALSVTIPLRCPVGGCAQRFRIKGLVINRSYDNEDGDGGGSLQEQHTEIHSGHQLETTEL